MWVQVCSSIRFPTFENFPQATCKGVGTLHKAVCGLHIHFTS